MCLFQCIGVSVYVSVWVWSLIFVFFCKISEWFGICIPLLKSHLAYFLIFVSTVFFLHLNIIYPPISLFLQLNCAPDRKLKRTKKLHWKANKSLIWIKTKPCASVASLAWWDCIWTNSEPLCFRAGKSIYKRLFFALNNIFYSIYKEN